MSRLLARVSLLLASLALAMVAIVPSASAQDVELYPGPFGDSADFTEGSAEQLPGEDLDGDGISDASVPDGTSIDANPAGNGLSFVPADVQPSSDPADSTVGGTGGGDSGAGLAVTGVESESLMAAALGLLAVGGMTLVTSRRRVDALD